MNTAKTKKSVARSLRITKPNTSTVARKTKPSSKRRTASTSRRAATSRRKSAASAGFITIPKFLRSKHKRLPLIIFIVLFATVGSYLLIFSHAATSTIATVEAESMTLSTGTSVIADTSASNSQAIRFASNATATSSVSFIAPATGLTLRAKGVQCKGAPTMVVKVDGIQVLSSSVSATSWTDYNSGTLNLTATTHSLSVAFTNDNNRNGCSRDLYVDKLTFSGTVTAPTVNLIANPTSVTAGGTSTLTWSSTNATSCTASNGWTGTKATSGSEATAAINATTIYTLSCTGSGGTRTASATVMVGGAVSDLMNRKDLMYGSEIGAWIQDGKPAVDTTTNIPNLFKSARFTLVRFAMYDCFQGMTCGTDNHAGTQTRANFDVAIDGIRNNLNAEPFFKLLPIAPDPIGYPAKIDGNKFCPPKTNLAMNLPLYKAVVDQAGSRIKLYESTNEGEVTCYNEWGYAGIAATGVSTTLGTHFAQNMPALKKYARSKGIDIKTVGYVGYPQGASGWGNACTNPSIKAVIEFNDAVYQAYVNSGNDPDYIPDAQSIHTYPHSPDFQDINGNYDSDNCIFQYHKIYIQKWRQYLISKWGSTIGNQIKLSDSEWQAGRSTWIDVQTAARMQQYYADWYKYVLQGQALPDGSVGTTERWWNANLFLVASDNNTYDWIKHDGTTYPWYETIKNISLSDPNR